MAGTHGVSWHGVTAGYRVDGVTPTVCAPPVQDFWTPAAAQQAFVVEDLYGWSLLAYNGTSIAPLRCAQPAYSSWAQCLTPEVERTSPTYGL